MMKELQDIAWNCLPKEFKEEVKAMYNRPFLNDLDFGYKSALLNLFGHNLTSDAEGEEMLTVSRKRVQRRYHMAYKCKHSGLLSHDDVQFWKGWQGALDDLFGSKCLPDIEPKPAEPKFKVGDKVRISCAFSSGEIWDSVLNGRVATIAACYRESNNWIYCFKEPIRDFAEFWLEPCTKPSAPLCISPETDGYFPIPVAMMDEQRLNIATKIAQGMLAAGEDYSGDCTFIVKKSLEIADGLIAGCKQE